jgi:1-deoxy-D-xylulose-5-phosphate synthase
VSTGYTQAFAEAIVKEGEADSRLVAITAAMPGPTGLIPFQERFPDRFFDVGIAEQHAVTGAAGMAMGGLRPVVAVYSTFLNRAWDQVVYDVALHRLPVIFCVDRAGITGPDGASHHGVYDMALMSKVPGMRVFAPSSAQELAQMLHDAVGLVEEGPIAIRYARGAARQVTEHEVGEGLHARRVVSADGADVCIIAIGKMLEVAEKAAAELAEAGTSVNVWDARCCAPLDPEMIAAAAAHTRVVTIEDGIRDGGIGMSIADQVTAIDPSTVLRVLGVPTTFIPHDPKSNNIHAKFGLDVAGIITAATE